MAVLHTVSEYKDSISGKLSGLNTNSLSDFNATLESAVSTLIQRADIPEASGIQNIVLYSGVTNYECDDTIFGTAIKDVRPQGISRPPWDSTSKTYNQRFDLLKNYSTNSTLTAFEFQNGVPIIKINFPFQIQEVTLDPMTSIGNWAVGGTASNLVADTAVYYQQPASLRFSLTTGAGTLTETLSSTTNISTYEDVGVAFAPIFIPSGASNLTSIALRIGSDSSNYNSVTATTPFIGNFTNSLWQLVAFDFSTASQVGTPDWSNIDYFSFVITVSGSITNFRIGDLFISQPTPAQILFQSSAIFLPVGSTTPLTRITANTDTIILNPAAYNLYVYEGAMAVLENMSGGMGDPMYERLAKKLGIGSDGRVIGGLYTAYTGDNPSEEIRQTEPYYNPAQGGWMGYNSSTGN